MGMAAEFTPVGSFPGIDHRPDAMAGFIKELPGQPHKGLIADIGNQLRNDGLVEHLQ